MGRRAMSSLWFAGGERAPLHLGLTLRLPSQEHVPALWLQLQVGGWPTPALSRPRPGRAPGSPGREWGGFWPRSDAPALHRLGPAKEGSLAAWLAGGPYLAKAQLPGMGVGVERSSGAIRIGPEEARKKRHYLGGLNRKSQESAF